MSHKLVANAHIVQANGQLHVVSGALLGLRDQLYSCFSLGECRSIAALLAQRGAEIESHFGARIR